MALRSVISSRIPLVIVLGATGTGKTKLGLELAQRYGTEIISADSMQIYKYLDIVTAKATVQERELARHHLVDILEPHQMFTVVDFRNRALKIIENLIEQGKIPLVVGGTNYYVESIVYKILVEESDDNEALLWDKSRRKRDFVEPEYVVEVERKRTMMQRAEDNERIKEATTSKGTNKDKLDEVEFKNVISKGQLIEDIDNEAMFTNEEIHAKLQAIDPDMASRLHPNNRRKILRAIEVWLKTGRRHSEILDQQKLSEGQLRRPGSTIILWLKCDQNVHDERLNKRVDSMLEEGLIQEMLDFHARHNKHRIQEGHPPDYTQGVFQTLGFKEFHEYLMLPEEERNSESGNKLFQKCYENMKIATRRYARRQNKTVRGRFLEHPTREVAKIYELDTTNLDEWDKSVTNKAIHIIESHLNDTTCEYSPIAVPEELKKKTNDGNSYNYCEVCDRIMIGDNVYTTHLKSFKHKRVLHKKRLLEKTDNQRQKDVTGICDSDE